MLILASQSPRRRGLIGLIDPAAFSVSPGVDETADPSWPAEMVPELLARRKAEAVAAAYPDQYVVGADTAVSLEGRLLGKPRDPAEAAAMLRQLSGRTHRVYTGVAICLGARTASFTQVSAVTFYPLSEAQIEAYVATGEPMDKAGAYGLQGGGALLVERVEGDPFNVVGLPVARLSRALAALRAEGFDAAGRL